MAWWKMSSFWLTSLSKQQEVVWLHWHQIYKLIFSCISDSSSAVSVCCSNEPHLLQLFYLYWHSSYRKDRQQDINTVQNITGTIYRASVTSVMWRHEKTRPTPATVCSPCCHLANNTEVSAAVPPDYRAASFLRLWYSSIHPQHYVITCIFFLYCITDYNLHCVVQHWVVQWHTTEPWMTKSTKTTQYLTDH